MVRSGILEAQWLVRSGRTEEAIEALERHLTSHPGDDRAASALGRLYLREGHPERAARWLQHALAQTASRTASAVSDPVQEVDDLIGESDLEYIENELPDGQNGLSGRELARLVDPGLPCVSDPDDASNDQVLRLNDGAVARPEVPTDPALGRGSRLEDADESVFAAWEAREPRLGNEDELRELLSAFDDVPSMDSPEDDASDDRLSVEERAMQYAAAVAADAGWTEDELTPLVEVFTHHRSHYKTRQVVSELVLEWKLNSQELEVLFSLRSHWAAGGFNRAYWADHAIDLGGDLPWRLGLKLLRRLRFESAEEAMLFIDDCFEDWCTSTNLLNTFSSFRSYLDHVLDHMETIGERWNDEVAPFIDYSLFPREASRTEVGSLCWRELQEYGLLAHQSEESDRVGR